MEVLFRLLFERCRDNNPLDTFMLNERKCNITFKIRYSGLIHSNINFY